MTTEGGRAFRIAAVGDIHIDSTNRGCLAAIISAANREADVLALCGDLTRHGRVEEIRAVADELKAADIPVVAVLGNHDYEGEAVEELREILTGSGVHLLDGDHVVVGGVGFVGTKGFAGGFGRGTLGPFGEGLIKQFVQAALDEALKLEKALRVVGTEQKVVVLHYSPIPETLRGEPEVIYAFLGSSRLLPPLETHGATVIFHGHAHHGIVEAETPAGIPVFNVAYPVLQENGKEYLLYTCSAPDRRGGGRAERAPPPPSAP